MEQKLTLTLESFRACEAAEGPATGRAGISGLSSLPHNLDYHSFVVTFLFIIPFFLIHVRDSCL